MQLQEIILWGAKAVRGWRYFAARYVVGTVLHSFSCVKIPVPGKVRFKLGKWREAE